MAIVYRDGELRFSHTRLAELETLIHARTLHRLSEAVASVCRQLRQLALQAAPPAE